MLAFVTYETAYSPCGGIAAVLGRLPDRMSRSTGQQTLVFTPYHHNLPRLKGLATTSVGTVGVDFDGRTILVELLKHDSPAAHIFLRPEDPFFFAGAAHPYDVSGETLLRDSLFFGAAVARAIRIVQPGANWTLLLQDWEAATVAIAVSGQTARPRMFLTLHNSYDVAVSGQLLSKLGMSPQACPGETVLGRALGLCQWPVFTVSTEFARDLVDDVFQSQVLAPHLAGPLGPRVVGIDNGLFTDKAIPAEVLTTAKQGDPNPLMAWKREQQAAFLAALDALRPEVSQPIWGNLQRFSRDSSPLFVMAGRDDGRQKGYDVAAAAARECLTRGRCVRFVFFPIPSDEGLEALVFLRELAEDFPERALILPFRFTAGYVQALRGATCGMMPSFYEPFGMANEYYLNGTLGLGRATGGILQQIVPWPLQTGDVHSLSGTIRGELETESGSVVPGVETSMRKGSESRLGVGLGMTQDSARGLTIAGHDPALARLCRRIHSPTAAPTGFLFHEAESLPTELEDWREINRTGTRAQPDRLRARRELALFQSLVESMVGAIDLASEVASRPECYARLLLAGLDHLENNFSWDRAASEYLRYAEGCVEGGLLANQTAT